MLLLLADVLQDARSAARAVDADAHDVAERARVELGAHYAEDLSLAALARAVGRLAQPALPGVPARDRDDAARLPRAACGCGAALEALVRVRPDLTALALDLGYASHSHFARSFRRAFGLTPSEARGRISSGSGPTARPRTRCPEPS